MVYFLNEEERRYILRGLLTKARENPVDSSWRGWSWDQPPLEPPYDGIRLGVHEIAVRECSTMRDIYLKYVERVRGVPNKRMIRGAILHRVVEEVIIRAKILIYSSAVCSGAELSASLLDRREKIVERISDEWKRRSVDAGYTEEEFEKLLSKAKTLWTYEVSQIAANVDRTLAKHPYISLDALVHTAIPVVVEQRLDGRFLGLSPNLSADALSFAPIVLDLKTGEFRSWQYLSTTGYALVLEALNETPIDVGVLVNTAFINNRLRIVRTPHIIDDSLRMRFIEIRDEMMELIANAQDPGIAKRCPADCPYIRICRGKE